jgi:hypothetical protein
MIITPLWHTEFLLDIENVWWENVRILVDTWFSDFAIWDMMERSVKFRLDQEKISTIDAMYISHAHCDHFDPYMLIEFYASKQQKYPLLILPNTLQYLSWLIEKYIPNAPIKWLSNNEIFVLKWIEITWLMFEQDDITNEDDVMILSIASSREIVFAEIDTLPSDTLEIQKSLVKLFSKKTYETILYLASRNELEWNLKILDYDTEKARENLKRSYLAARREEIEWWYAKWEDEEYQDTPNFMTLPGFCRGFIGQWICYPYVFSEKLATLAAFTLSEVVEREVSFAEQYGYDFPQKALLPGRQFRIENGNIEQGRKECSIGEIQKYIPEWKAQSDIRIYATWPLIPRELSWEDIEQAKQRILEVLNYRFLPYWSASPTASLRSVMIKNKEWVYRIGFRVSVIAKNEAIQETGNGLLWPREWQEQWVVFEYSFADVDFREVPYVEGMRIDESYWLEDILDFLDGKQELYSNFWHKLEPNIQYRLWTCLGANFCNNDIVLRKYELHFERAISGLTAKQYMEDIYRLFSY